MKQAHIVNAAVSSGRALEKALAAKLRELLGSVPWLRDVQVMQNPAPFERAFDILATVTLPTSNFAELWVECHDLPRPSRFPYVALHDQFYSDGKRTVRVPVLAAPLITGRMAELCEKHNWSWFDLAGNCRINVPDGIFIERRGNDPVHRRPKPAANLGTAESARIVRALLAPDNAGRRWTQRDMQLHCKPGVSIGLVNKVVLFLREQAFVMDHEDGGFRLHDPLGLLGAWRDAYRFDRHQRRGYFTLKRGQQLRDALASLGSFGGFAAYAAFSAADFQAPNVRQPKTWLFVGAQYEDEFASIIEAKPVDSGENLVVLIPEDSGVFYLQEGDYPDRLACTNPVQTYVDLSHCGGRGEEAAEALLEYNLKPLWFPRGNNP